jgi:hypothetical protein
MSPFACLSPVKDSQYFLWLIVVQSLIAFLATPIEKEQTMSIIKAVGGNPGSDIGLER